MTTVARTVRTSPVWPVLVGVGLLAGITAAALAGLSVADALTATGLPDPGPVTTYGLPFVRAAGELAAVVAVGSFLLAAFLVPPQSSGVLDVAGYRALRTGTVASAVWTVCAVLLVPLTRLRRHRAAAGQPTQPVVGLVGCQPDRNGGHLALDRPVRRRGHGGQHSGAALVVDAAALCRSARHPGADRLERALVGRRLARPGHQQPADPPDRRPRCGPVDCWPC